MNNRYLSSLAGVLAALAPSCTDYTYNTEVQQPTGDEIELSFASGAVVRSSVWTKAKNMVQVEDGIISAALAIYDSNGVLVHHEKVQGEFSGFSKTVRLNKNRVYSCYLVTGYIAEKIIFPASVAEIPDLELENDSVNDDGEYDLTGTLRDYGPDRAGALADMSPAQLDLQDGQEDGKVTIPVQSLWAKVAVTLDASAIEKVQVGLENGGIQSCGAAMGSRIFKPFSTNGARNTSDRFSILPVETRTADGGIPSNTPFVFYVPENMLGTLLENNIDSDKKTPAEVLSKHGEAVSQAVEKSAVTLISPAFTEWGDTGSITFRFCLGDNTTSNFDIKRNTFYDVTVSATENGFAIKEWKANLDVPDSRTLDLYHISKTQEGSADPVFEHSDFAEVGTSSDFYLVPEYSVNGTDHTADYYSSSPGWELSESTLEQLNQLGINCLLQLGHSFEDGTTAAALRFRPQSALSSGQAFPITIRTHDGVHTATVIIQVKADGTVTTDWETRPEYIGQQGTLMATSMTGSVASVSYSVATQYRDYIDVDDSAGNGSCIVKAKKAGEAFITYTGESSTGATICTGEVPILIKVPRLYAGATNCDLSPDGTAVMLQPYYTDESGTRMTVAGSDAQGNGTKFAPSLYSTLLNPVVSFPSSSAAAFLGSSGNSVFVARLESGGQSIVPLFGNTISGAIKVSAKAASDINPALCSVSIKKPVGHNGNDDRLGIIDNNILTGSTLAHSQSVAIKKGTTATIPGLSLSYGSNLSNLSIADTGDLTFTLNSNGTLSVTGKNSFTSLTGGHLDVNIQCRNTRSGQTISVSAGYLDVYLHTKPMAVMDLSGAYPVVKTDIAGAGQSSAISSMRADLFANGNAVLCSFKSNNRSFYDLGYGYWSDIDGFDSNGEQFTAPDYSGMLTEYKEAGWPGNVQFGAIAYYIYPGNIESEYGKYNTLNGFYSWNESAHLLFDYSVLSCLIQSPFNSAMYHYTYGSQTDPYGYSYYILEYITIIDWLK